MKVIVVIILSMFISSISSISIQNETNTEYPHVIDLGSID